MDALNYGHRFGRTQMINGRINQGEAAQEIVVVDWKGCECEG